MLLTGRQRVTKASAARMFGTICQAHNNTPPTMRAILAISVLAALTACSTTPSLSTEPSFNLSGKWRLVPDESDAPPNPRNAMNRVSRESIERRPGRSAAKARVRGAVFAFVTQDFPVLTANRMRIEQSGDSMGIDYTPGTYRDVSWGRRERGIWEVYAGWDETEALIIDSRGNDIRAVERMILRPDGRLQVDVTVNADKRQLDLTRVFEPL